MFRILNSLCTFLFLMFLSSASAAGTTLPSSEKALLQAGMQQHIDRNQINGAYLSLNPTSGEVGELFPVKAHPMILRMGKYFVLCSDFRDRNKKAVNVDFYMARRGKSYVVFHAAVAQRAQLEQLMKAGKAEMVE